MDLTKNRFQRHGVKVAGEIVPRRRLKRQTIERRSSGLQPYRIGMEAGGGAHHRAWRSTAMDDEVRIVPP